MRPSSGKSSLVLMVQLIMLLIFAVAAAACLRIFVISYSSSAEGEEKVLAMFRAQEVAETIKSLDGDLDAARAALGGSEIDGETGFAVYYDADMSRVGKDGSHDFAVIVLPIDSKNPYLGVADISVCDTRTRQDDSSAGSNSAIYSIEIAWQEVGE